MDKRYLYMTLCQRCTGPHSDASITIMTAFIPNADNSRCENCGNVAAALAQVRFLNRESER